MKHYRGPQLCKIAGVTYRQIDYWARTGMLRPSVMEANGTGTQRLYSETDVKVALVLGRLSEFGISPGNQLAQEVIDHVREFGLRGEVHEGSGLLVVDLSAIEDPIAVSA